MKVRRGEDGGRHITNITLLLLCAIPGYHVTRAEDLPEEILVQCGIEKCNILEQFCTLDDRCDYCNEDECRLPIAPGERPPQCFFKCNNVMEKLKTYSTGGYPAWIVYFLGPYSALTTVLLVLLVWMFRTKIKCCNRREIQMSSEEQDLVSHPVSEISESPPAVQGPSRRSPVITSPQNDREDQTLTMSSQ